MRNRENMDERFSRTALIFGDEGMSRLGQSRVAVFGVGGVGGACVLALARSGIGAIDVCDDDVVSVSNINRQAIAVSATIGRAKVDVAAEIIAQINPQAVVRAHRLFYTPESADAVDLSVYDYIIDAIDTVKAKTELIVRAQAAGVPVISAMGAGNKLDPTRFEVADLYDTSVCPLCRAMRAQRKTRGSVSFVPPAVGLILAGEVVRALSRGGEKA